ncbi:MAG: cell wall metabolism sensor histidine kinase WalK [Gammaproteobacteria bacterium]|nr:cell wall metabolism sensor histidine kinase WalK [Gammaproteobacteria bacterium]MDH5778363.1 cell wall metabolism sensor histidine kinase WalK [Gammaproteobacteria bacterium]
MKLGLQGQYTILITAVVLVIVIGLGTLLLIQTRSTISALTQTSEAEMERELHAQLKSRGEIIARLLADNLINPLYHSDMEAIYQLLLNAKHQQDVTHVHVLDKAGFIVHDGIEGIPGLGKRSSTKISDKALTSSELLAHMTEDVFYVAMPVLLGDLRLGTVLVEMSTEGIHAEIAQVNLTLTGLSGKDERRQLYSMLLATLVFIIIGIVLSAMLARSFTRPIKELATKIKDVGHGQYDIQLSFSRRDEIGFLATEFQEMVQRLRETTVSKDFLDNIIASMNDALIVLNLDGTISMINAATCHLLGEGKSHLLSSKLFDLIIEDEETISQWLQEVLDKGDLVAQETSFRQKNDSIIPVSFSASLMHNHKGEPHWIVCVAQDISERKQIERMKDEFIATVSHELRTPLTAIYGTLSLLSSENKEVLNGDNQQLIDVAYNNSIQLVSLVNDLLDSQKIVSGKMKYEMSPVNMWDVLRESVENNQAYATKHAVKYKILEDKSKMAIVNADQHRLLQVMANLLSNAAKFSHNGSDVEISLQRIDSMIEVSVQDYGEGIPDDFQQHIFERFRQADGSTTRLAGGTGLGLSISKDIIEQMNGEIGYQTEQGKGARFYFRLPVADV